MEFLAIAGYYSSFRLVHRFRMTCSWSYLESGIGITTLVGVILGLNPMPEAIVSAPPGLAPTFGVAIANLPDIFTLEMVVVVITFLFIDFFDAVGTIIAVCNGIGVTDEEGNIPNVKPALFADAAGTVVGSVLGTAAFTRWQRQSGGMLC